MDGCFNPLHLDAVGKHELLVKTKALQRLQEGQVTQGERDAIMHGLSCGQILCLGLQSFLR